MGRVGTATTGYEDLKNIAVGRLFLDNIPHVKTHWPMVTPFLSQIALSFGCDDVEGTVVYERIYHEAGAQTDMHMPYLELVRLIRGAGKRPVERDSLYQAVREQFDDPPPEPSLRRGALAAGGARRMRLGRIPWINCYPVYGAIDRGLVPVPAELVTGTASELNDLLAAGELQVSVVSAVEYARNAAAYHLLPDLAITCDGPVHSVALFSRAAGRGARRPHGAADRVVPHLGPAARAALPASLEVSRRGSPPRGPRRAISTRWPGCPHEAVLVIGDAALLLARRGVVSGRAGSGRRVEGTGPACPSSSRSGPPGATRRRPRCRRCTSGCWSRARGDCAHLDELAAEAAAGHRGRGAGLPGVSRRSGLRALVSPPGRTDRFLPPAGAGWAGAGRVAVVHLGGVDGYGSSVAEDYD